MRKKSKLQTLWEALEASLLQLQADAQMRPGTRLSSRKKRELQTLRKNSHGMLLKLQAEINISAAASCYRCGHWWKTRTSEPKKCPRCRSKHWDRPRVNRQGMRPQA